MVQIQRQLSLNYNIFFEFILYCYYKLNYFNMSLKVADKLTSGWPPQLIQRKQEMDHAYNSLKDFNKTHKYFEDYSIKKQLATVEKKLDLPPKNNSPVINLTTSSYSDLFILKSAFTGDLGDYCALVQQQISELEASLIRNNVFIAAYEVDSNRNSKMFIPFGEMKKRLEDYESQGYVKYLFVIQTDKKIKKIEHTYSFYKKKSDDSKIVVLTNNGYLVCNGNLYEENSIYYTLINRLLYFQSNIRELCCYQYHISGKEYVLFSRYTKRELRELCLDPAIIESLIQVEFFKVKDKDGEIITFLPVVEYIKRRNTELKKRFGIYDEKVVRSEPALSGKYLDDIYTNLYTQMLTFVSAVVSPYMCLYLRPDIDPALFTNEIELIDAEKITSKDEYDEHSKKQLYEEVTTAEVTDYQESMNNFFIEISNDNHQKFLEETGLSKEDCEIISQNYLFGQSSEVKPTFFTHRDYLFNNSGCETFPYIPEIKNKLKGNLEEFRKKLKPETSQDFNILSLRPCIFGKAEYVKNINDIQYCSSFYITRSFYWRNILYVPELIRWSPFFNKYYMKLLFNRELLFPAIYYYSENKDKYLYLTDNSLIFIGYIQLKLKKNADLIIFIFRDGNIYKLYNFRGNRIILNQGINDFIRWVNIELNVLYQYGIIHKNLHIYESNNYGQKMYLFSKKSMEEIREYYRVNKVDDSEIQCLQEVVMFKDRTTNLFIFKQKEMVGGYVALNKIKLDNKKYDTKYEPKLIYDKLKKYIFFKDIPFNIWCLFNKLCYIRNNFIYQRKIKNIKYDKKILAYIENLTSILENKFICWDLNIEIFSILNLLKDKLYKEILSISSSRCCIESIKFYFKDTKITNLYFDKFMQEKSINLVNKIKENYFFDDIPLDNINLLNNKSFDFIFFDCIYKAHLKDDDYESYDVYIGIEKENISLFSKIKDILKYMNKGGILYIRIPSLLDEKTLLIIQFISQCFIKNNIINLIIQKTRLIQFFNFVFEDFIGIVEPLPYLSNKFMKSIKRFYKDFFEELEDYKLRYEMIKNNLDNKKYIKSLKIQNLAYSYKFAQDLGFEVYKNILIDDSDDSTYGINIKKNDILLQSLQKMFSLDEGVYVVMRNRDKNLFVNININDDVALPEQIVYYNKLQNISIRQIDFRPIHVWDETKKFIRYYEHTLNVFLQNYRISIEKTKPVSRAWIKFYELLFVTKVFDNLKGYLKVFHICEAPGTFIMSTIYYLDRWNRDLKYEWDATTLNPRYLSKNGIGDTYDLLKKYKDKWTFGFDGTGDITVEKNIKHYREMCKDRDFIIGDCGLPWGDDALPGIVLYYCQILFILYNLKEGGGCIFKQILNYEHKIIVDMMYLLYYCFDIVKIYKPTQNTFSGEFYIVCTGYKRLLKDRDFDILFKVLDDKQNIHKKSILNQEYSKEFIYQLANVLDKIIVNFNQAIDRQLFYADFWHLIQHEDRDEIKKYIDVKNKDWVETFLLKNITK
jgi:hypothetical protein